MTAPDPARLHQSIRQLEGDGGRVDVEQLEGLVLPQRRELHALSPDVQTAIASLPALLDLIRRQDAALTAVRELADEWDHPRPNPTNSIYIEGIELGLARASDRLRTALASPDTTQEAS